MKLGKLHTEKGESGSLPLVNQSHLLVPHTFQLCHKCLCPEKCFSEEGYQKDVWCVSW